MFDESSEPITDIISRHARLKARQKGQQPVATVNNKPVEQVPPVAQIEQEAPVEEEQNKIKMIQSLLPLRGNLNKLPQKLLETSKKIMLIKK